MPSDAETAHPDPGSQASLPLALPSDPEPEALPDAFSGVALPSDAEPEALLQEDQEGAAAAFGEGEVLRFRGTSIHVPPGTVLGCPKCRRSKVGCAKCRAEHGLVFDATLRRWARPELFSSSMNCPTSWNHRQSRLRTFLLACSYGMRSSRTDS